MGVARKYLLHKHEDLTNSLEYTQKARHGGDPSAGEWKQLGALWPSSVASVVTWRPMTELI